MTDITDTTETTNAPVTGQFFDYDSAKQYPVPTGYRMVTCCYRAKGTAKAARPNQAIFIPDWIASEVITNELPRLMEYLQVFLQSTEEDMVKAKHKACSTTLGDSLFTLQGLVQYMASNNMGQELEAGAIAEWFKDSGLDTALLDLYTEKANEAKALVLVEFVKTKLQELAKASTVWPEPVRDKIKPLVEVVESDSIRDKLLARIAAMPSADDDKLLDAL